MFEVFLHVCDELLKLEVGRHTNCMHTTYYPRVTYIHTCMNTYTQAYMYAYPCIHTCNSKSIGIRIVSPIVCTLHSMHTTYYPTIDLLSVCLSTSSCTYVCMGMHTCTPECMYSCKYVYMSHVNLHP